MTKTIYIIRHSQVAPPFDNYDNLQENDLIALCLQKVDPDINTSTSSLINTLLNHKEINNTQVIIHSSLKRAVNTAKAIKKSIKDLTLINEPLLKEIIFDPITIKNKFNLDSISVATLRPYILQSTCLTNSKESLKIIHKRILNLLTKLKKRNENHITLISHGFFIQLLDIYLTNKTLNQQLIEDYTPKRYEYLNGFKFSL